MLIIENGSFNLNKINYEYCFSEINDVVYTVVIDKFGNFETSITYTFSSSHAGLIFIEFIKTKLQNDNFQYLNKIAESIDVCSKFNIAEMFESYAPPIKREHI